MLEDFCEHSGLDLSGYKVFKYEKDVLITPKNAPFRDMHDKVYFLRFGKRIGSFEGAEFIPNWHTGRDFALPKLPVHVFETESELDTYLRGVDMATDAKGKYLRFEFAGVPIGLGPINPDTHSVKNLVPKQWLKK